MLPKQLKFNTKHYSGFFREGHVNYRPHGGVPFVIHETIPIRITLKNPLQAVEAAVNMGIEITVVSFSRSMSDWKCFV